MVERRIEEAVADAVGRGALTSRQRARYWLSQGNRAAPLVDQLRGSDMLAPPTQARASSGGLLGYVHDL